MGPIMASMQKQSISLLAAMGLSVDVSGNDYRDLRALHYKLFYTWNKLNLIHLNYLNIFLEDKMKVNIPKMLWPLGLGRFPVLQVPSGLQA